MFEVAGYEVGEVLHQGTNSVIVRARERASQDPTPRELEDRAAIVELVAGHGLEEVLGRLVHLVQ